MMMMPGGLIGAPLISGVGITATTVMTVVVVRCCESSYGLLVLLFVIEPPGFQCSGRPTGDAWSSHYAIPATRTGSKPVFCME